MKEGAGSELFLGSPSGGELVQPRRLAGVVEDLAMVEPSQGAAGTPVLSA